MTLNSLFNVFSKSIEECVDLGVQLTTACTMGCDYCGADRFKRFSKELDYATLLGWIRRYKEYATKHGKVLSVSLDGADNFQYSRIEDLLGFLKDERVSYSIKCNAVTLTKNRITLLKETNCTFVRMTIFGNEEIHNAHRGFDKFQTVVDKTKQCIEAGLYVGWNLTVGSQNVHHFDEVISLIPTMGLASVSENRMYRANKANSDEYQELSPQEWKMFLGKLFDKWLEVGDDKFPLSFKDSLWIPFLHEKEYLNLDTLPDNMTLGCGLEGEYACVDIDGHIKGCLTFESAAKELNKTEHMVKIHPREELYFTKDSKFTEDSVCSKCVYYKYCRGCPAITLANTGCKNNKDPQCWVTW